MVITGKVVVLIFHWELYYYFDVIMRAGSTAKEFKFGLSSRDNLNTT